MTFSPLLRLRRRAELDSVGAIELLESSVLGYSRTIDGWNPITLDVLEPLSADAAKAAHLGGRTYSVVERRQGQVVVASLANPYEAKVTRFDPSGTTPTEIREFRELDGKLWLRGVKRCNGGTTVPGDQQITDWFTWVRPDTTATWTRFDSASPQGRPHSLCIEWSPEPHWFDRPSFGDYDDLIGEQDLLRQLWPDLDPLPFLGR